MQADAASSADPVAAATKDSGFSGLAIMMIIAATLTGVLIYWLTVKFTVHQNMDHTRSQAEIQASKPPTSTGSGHTRMMPSGTDTASPTDRTATSTPANQATNSSAPMPGPRAPAINNTYRPAYPAYRAYPYPPAPPRYAVPPYPRYYMPPPGYPYPPAPWPPRR